jgi:spore coat polysaccharide biosynthesis protein SpsF
MKVFYNEQEKFWKGNFGNQYIKRNKSKNIINNNYSLFKKIFKKKFKINSLIELGANIGNNIVAINKILKIKKITAVEINKKACERLRKINNVNVLNESILKLRLNNKKFDLLIIMGVLIHIHPKYLKIVYKKIAQLSKKYVLICEYYNPKNVSVNYRGHKNKLFKNDYAGEFMKIYKNYKLIDYGFSYHLDNKYLKDDSTYFLLKRT